MAANSHTTAPGTDPALTVTDAMILIDHELTHLPITTALQLINFARNRLDATEARLLANRYENGANDRDVENLVRNQGNTSKKEAQKRASRAKATNANPDIANRMSQGNLSTEQADVIADAAAQTNGAAACDKTLIDNIAATTPEQGRKKAKKYVNDRQNPDDIQDRHDKQHHQRGWYRHRLPNGNSAITFHGTDEKIDDIERNVNAQANTEYQTDGGRNTPKHKHPRTSDQRSFDAAHKLITGSAAPASDAESNAARASDYTTTDPANHTDETSSSTTRTTNTATTGSTNNSPTTTTPRAGKAPPTPTQLQPPQPQTPSRPTRRSPRDVVHVNVTLEQLTGTDKSAIIASDGKPLPRSIFNEIICSANLITHLFDGNGELLWQGRKKRLATPAQINGLIARDGECVQCGTHHSKCVAHHLLPWEAIDQGETNIDNLAFLCNDCHHRIHQQKLTLYYDPASQTWKTRAAKPHESPPENQHSKPKPQPGKSKYRTKPAPTQNRQHPENPPGPATPPTGNKQSDGERSSKHHQSNNFHQKLF